MRVSRLIVNYSCSVYPQGIYCLPVSQQDTFYLFNSFGIRLKLGTKTTFHLQHILQIYTFIL